MNKKKLPSLKYENYLGESTKIIQKFWLSALLFIVCFLHNTTGYSATYYLENANVGAAQTPANWNTDNTGGGGSTNATNFTTAGDIFVILSGQSATFAASTTFGSASAAVTLQIDGTASISASQTLIIGVSGATSIVIFNLTSTTSISGAGNFTLAAASTLRTANVNGITGTNASLTNSGSKTLSTTGNYEYIGAGSQASTGLPATIRNLVLGGTASVTLGATTTMSGTLTVGAGTSLDLSTFNLGSPTTTTVFCGATSGSVITGSSGILTLGGGVTVTDNGGGTDEATISCLVSLGSSVRTFTVADDGTTATDLTLSNTVSGSGGITKAGAGILTLTGVSTYTGAVTISAGVLSVDDVENQSTNSPLGTGAGTPAIAMAAGATLRYVGTGNSSTNRVISFSVAGPIIDASGSGSLTLGAITASGNRALILTGTGTGIVSGVITLGSGTMTKNGTGTWTLSGANTYTGATTISDGTLIAGAAVAVSTSGPFGSASSAIVMGNATTTTNNGSPRLLIGGAFTMARTITIANQATTGTYSIGGNTDNNSTFSGLITFNQPFSITQIATTGGNKLTISGGITGGLAGTKNVIFDNIGEVLASTVAISNGTGTTAIVKQNTGITTLSFANTYTGTTTVSNGTLIAGAAVAVSTNSPFGSASTAIVLGDAGTTTNNGSPSLRTGGAFTMARTITVANQATTGTYSIGGNTDNNSTFSGLITFSQPFSVTQVATTGGNKLTISGGITGGLAGTKIVRFDNIGEVLASTVAISNGTGVTTIVKQNTGIATLSFANTYTGTTTVSNGTLIAGAAVAVSTNSPFGNASSAIELGDAGTTTNNGSPSLRTGGAFTMARTITITNQTTSGTYSIGGNTDNNSTFSGLITFSQPFSFTQVATTGGNKLTVSGGITGGLAGSKQVEFDNVGEMAVTTVAISDGTGTTRILKDNTGLTTLSFANTYTGTTTVNAGTLKASVITAAFGSASPVIMADVSGAILDITGFNNTIGSLTGGGTTGGNVTLGAATLSIGSDNTSPAAYAGVISGSSGAIIKTGTGSLILSGASTYTGTTTVSAGSLIAGAAVGVSANGPFGNASTAIILGDAATSSNNSSPSLLTGGAFTLARIITVANQATSGTYTIGGNTNTNSTFSGLITFSQPFSITQIATTGGNKLTISGGITGGLAGTKIVKFDNIGDVDVTIVAISNGTGTTSITKQNTGIATMSFANTYTGATTVNAGTLKAGVATSAFGVTSAVSMANVLGAILDLNSNSNTIGSLTGGGATGGNISLGSGTLTVGNDNTSPTAYSGTFSGTGAIIKTGSGSLSFGSQNLTLNDITISSGTLVSTSGTLSILGNFSNSGTFTHNSGTIDFNKSGAQNIGTATFNNLSCINTGTKTATGNLVVDGTLTVASSTVLDMTSAFTLTGTLGTISNNGTIQTAVPTATSATPLAAGKAWNGQVTYTATTGLQTIVSGTYVNLTQSNTSVANTLGGNIAVSSVFTLSGGKLILSSNTLTLNGTISGMTASSSLTANGSSNITIGGSGALGTNLFLDQTVLGTSNRINNFTYNRPSVDITLGDTLEISGTMFPNGGRLLTTNRLKLRSMASGTARVAQGSDTSYIYGNVVVERYVPGGSGRRWRFFGAKVADATFADLKHEIFVTGTGGATNGFDVTISNQPSIYSYDETVITGDQNSGYVAVGHIDDPITVGKGYRIFIRGDRSDLGRLTGATAGQNEVTLNLTGPLNKGNIVLPVTYTTSVTPTNDGWNLVANPYASPIDWNAFHDANRSGVDSNFSGDDYAHIKQTVYIYDATQNRYASYNAVSEAVVNGLTGGIIPAGAAFWVQAVAASPTLTLKEVYKTSTAPLGVFKTTPAQFGIKLIQDSVTSDEAVLKYIPGTIGGLDAYDIPKLYGPDVNIASIGTDGSFLSANCKPFNGHSDTIPLSLGFAKSGDYRMEFNNAAGLGLDDNKTISLVDLFKQQIISVNESLAYNFSVDKNDPATFGNARFMIVIGEVTTGIPAFEAKAEAKKMYIFPSKTADWVTVYSNMSMGASSGITITDITGKTVATINNPNWDDTKLTLDLSSYQTGVYFISITDHGQTIQTLKCIKE